MADPGCDFKATDDAARCGRTPTNLLALGMLEGSAKRGDVSGMAGTLQYGHFCEDHLPEMYRRTGQTPPPE